MNFTNLTDLIGSGAEADVYRLDRYAIKLFKEHCSKTQVFYEAAVHTIIENAKLPIPEIHQIMKIENRWAIIMDMINGIRMNDIIFNDISNLKLYISQITDLQLKIHKIKLDGLSKLTEQLNLKISSTNRLNNNQKHHLIRMLNSFNIDNKLCHGDFHFMNLIKTDDDIVIIDWIDATVGNPEADICRTYMLYLLYAKDIADLYLEDYCKKSNKKKKDIIKWLPVIAGARLCENKENEFDMLLNWVNSELVTLPNRYQ